ncbi:MAG TPA: helix-turn-helix domain-containing protein [Rugosimonospora sp.]|nr:helix-turn-helix domain-containing protein [Rugosimonospora sp.]
MSVVAGWVRARLPGLIDEAYRTTLERIPLYRDDRPVPHDELRRSVALNLRSIVAALADPDTPLDLAAARETGRRRAHQEVPLPEVLQVYRICFATLWDTLVRHVREAGQPGRRDVLLDAASLIWRLSDEHAVALTEAYRAATAELLVAHQRRRSALVEALLTGRLGAEVSPWEAATLLDLPPDVDHVVVAAETRGLAEESLPGVEQRLAGHGVVSGWRLTPALQLGVVALRADQHGTVMAVLREVAGARTGVSPPYRALPDTPRALRLARAALAGIPAGQPEVRVFSSSPLAALMAYEPGEGRRLAAEVLGAVLELPDEDRGVMLDTLTAYLDHAGSTERAAEVLHCHPNTVRYRLRRLHELTGRSLSDPHQAAELAAAAYAIRLDLAVRDRRGPA